MKTAYGDHLTVTLEGHVATVTIDRPPNNHVSVELMSDLADALENLDNSNNCRAVVLTSAGKAFCAGADLVAPDGIAGSNTLLRLNAVAGEPMPRLEDESLRASTPVDLDAVADDTMDPLMEDAS